MNIPRSAIWRQNLPSRLEWATAFRSASLDHGRGERGPVAQLDTASAVAEVEPQRDAGGIDLPEAECAGIGFHATGQYRRSAPARSTKGRFVRARGTARRDRRKFFPRRLPDIDTLLVTSRPVKTNAKQAFFRTFDTNRQIFRPQSRLTVIVAPDQTRAIPLQFDGLVFTKCMDGCGLG